MDIMEEEKIKKNKNSKKWKRRLVNGLIALLLIIGLILIFNNPIRNALIGMNTKKYEISKVTTEQIKKNEKKDASFDFASVKLIDFQTVVGNQFNSHSLPVIGAVAVPEVGINLPIFRGVDNTSLLYGAGTLKPDEEMGKGNYALASHNVTGYLADVSLLFSPLSKAKSGMTVFLTDKTTIYQYKIDDVYSITPEHVELIEDNIGKTEVTLVTCADPQAKERIIVHGNYEKSVKFKDATKEMQDAFSLDTNQLN